MTDSNPTDSDQSIIDAAIAGDTAEFERLVMRYQNLVYRFILKKVRDPDKAEDLTQDTFVAAYRKLDAFKGDSRFSTWLVGIALNIVRNYVNRAPEKRYNHVSDESLNYEASGEDSPETVMERKTRMASLQRGIDSLPQDLKEVLILVSLEGQTYDEASQTLGLPLGTVKSKLFRARDQLRDFIRA